MMSIRVGAQPRGKAVYDAHCVECHGPSGRGDGPSAGYLTPRPRDFTTGKYKIRTTETGSVPSDEDLLGSVQHGLYGTAMPGWQRILADTDIADVVQYIKTLSPQFATPARPIPIGDGIPSSPTSVARGEQVYGKLQCDKCHGTDGRGTGAVTTAFEDDWQQPLRSADLTEPWTFHGGGTARDIYTRFRAGMTGTPMPSFADAASDGDMWDLANYVVSLARKPVWSMTADEVQQFYARLETDAKANPVKRGKYLLETLGCAQCHTPMDQNKRMLPGMYLAGGLLIRDRAIRRFSERQPDLGQDDWSRQLDRRRDQACVHEGHPARWIAAAPVPDGLRVVLDVDHWRPDGACRVPAYGSPGRQQGAAADTADPSAVPLGDIQDADSGHRSADGVHRRERRDKRSAAMKRF